MPTLHEASRRWRGPRVKTSGLPLGGVIATTRLAAADDCAWEGLVNSAMEMNGWPPGRSWTMAPTVGQWEARNRLTGAERAPS
jgi:hypothetical protein